MYKLSEHVKRVDNLEGHHKGIVVFNNDPDKLGRVKCYIEGVFEPRKESVATGTLLDIDKLPWVYPLAPMSTGGGGRPASGVFSVPEVYSELVVTFPFKSPYFPVYIGYWQSEKTHQILFDENYPNQWGWADSSGSWTKYDKSNGTIDFNHITGTKLRVFENGDIGIFSKGAMYWGIKGGHYSAGSGKGDLTSKSDMKSYIYGSTNTGGVNAGFGSQGGTGSQSYGGGLLGYIQDYYKAQAAGSTELPNLDIYLPELSITSTLKFVGGISGILEDLGKGFEQLWNLTLQTSPYTRPSDWTPAVPKETIGNIPITGPLGGISVNKNFLDKIDKLPGGLDLLIQTIPGGLYTVVNDLPGGFEGFSALLFQQGYVNKKANDIDELIALLGGIKGLIAILPKGVYQLFDYVGGGYQTWVDKVPNLKMEASNLISNDFLMLSNTLVLPGSGLGARPDEAIATLSGMDFTSLFNLGYTVETISSYMRAFPGYRWVPPPPDPLPPDYEPPLHPVSGYSGVGPAFQMFMTLTSVSKGAITAQDCNSAVRASIIKDQDANFVLGLWGNINLVDLYFSGHSDPLGEVLQIINGIPEQIDPKTGLPYVDSKGDPLSIYQLVSPSYVGSGAYALIKCRGGAVAGRQFVRNMDALGYPAPGVLEFVSGMQLNKIEYLFGGLAAVQNFFSNLGAYLTPDAVWYTDNPDPQGEPVRNAFLGQKRSLMKFSFGVAMGDLLRSGMVFDSILAVFKSQFRSFGLPPHNGYTGKDSGKNEGLYLNSVLNANENGVAVREVYNTVSPNDHRSLDLKNEDSKRLLENYARSNTPLADPDGIVRGENVKEKGRRLYGVDYSLEEYLASIGETYPISVRT